MQDSASKGASYGTSPRRYVDEDVAETGASIQRPLHRGKGRVFSKYSTSKDVHSSRPQSAGGTAVRTSSSPDAIALSEFTQRFSDSLPAEITVVEGANTSPVALNDKDVLKVHRIKEQSMVLARANENQQYLIPFNAAIEFCVLYDPENNISKALKGYSFEKGSDLMSAEIRPKLVCARSSWVDKDTNRVVVSNREVFVVKGASTGKDGKKTIKVYSITKHVTKELPEDCVASFSTKPSLLPLYLAEIMEYVKDPFPCKALLHDEGLMVPPHFLSLIRDQSGLVLSLASVSKKVVMEATYSRPDIENPIIMDIPVELPQVKVKVLQCTTRRRVVVAKETTDGSGGSDTDEATNADLEEEGEGRPIRNELSVVIGRVSVNEAAALRRYSVYPRNYQTASLSPGVFAQQYGHALPAQVKIVESYQTTTGTCLLADEIYKVHFVAATEGITAMDKKEILIPVSTDSCSQFGVIYNPHSNLTKAVNGYIFESVDDVVRAPQLPRVLCATQSHRSSSPTSSVEEGEVLILEKVEFAPWSKAASVLTAYSVREGVTKTLQAECGGRFTTDPSRVQLHVGDILTHLPSVLPTCAMMYLAGPGGEAISEPTMVTLLRRHPKSSLVATTVQSPKSDWNPNQPVEIPLCTPVKLMVIRTNVSPSGTGRLRPASIAHAQNGDHKVEDTVSISRSNPSSVDRYKELTRNIVDLTERFRLLDDKVLAMEGKLNGVIEQLRSFKEVRTTKSAERQFVESLGAREVLHLLDVAGLGMYSEAFNREKIDGQMLCVLTDTVLRRDLNVSSELHRLKLLNIISGAVDVRTWLAHSATHNTTV